MGKGKGREEWRGYLAIPVGPSNQHAKVTHLGCCGPDKPQPASYGAEELPAKTSQSIEL